MRTIDLSVAAALAAIGTMLALLGCEAAGQSTTADGDQAQCRINEDCPLGYNCDDGQCVDPTAVSCRTDDDCPLGKVCDKSQGLCVSPSLLDGDADTGADLPDVDDSWSDPDPETPAEIGTDYVANLCLPCAFDPDCPGDENFCIPDNSGNTYCGLSCRSGADCPPNYLCFNLAFGSQCYPMDGFCQPSCVDTGCGSGMACDPGTGKCETVNAGSQGFCEPCGSDADCQENGKCLADQTGNQFCGTDCRTESCTYANTYCRRLDENTRQCWPLSNLCASTCNCSTVNCSTHFTCNPADCSCQPDSTHCNSTGCATGYTCDYTSGQCQEGGGSDEDDCCLNPYVCGFSMECNTATCTCQYPSGYCSFDSDCPAGYTCDWYSSTCEEIYCKSCSGSGMLDCGFRNTCNNGYCATTCYFDSDCPSSARCEVLDPFWGDAYCTPRSGSCSGGTGGCNGVSYEGQCDGNVLKWCENNQVNQQNCDNYNARCALYADDGNYYCRGVEGGECGGTKPPCYTGYTCVSNVCRAQSADGDWDVEVDQEREADPEPELESDPEPEPDPEPDAGEESSDLDSSTSCDDVPDTGLCRGNVLYWCSNGTVKVANCTTYTATCGPQGNRYTCLGNEGAPCGGTADFPCRDDIACTDGACLAPPLGTCANPRVITSLPFSTSGTLVTSAGSTFDGASCDYFSEATATSPEYIFKVTLPIGKILEVEVTASWAIALHLADACFGANYGDCIQETDTGSASMTHIISAAGDYYLVLDSTGAGGNGAFSISVSLSGK